MSHTSFHTRLLVTFGVVVVIGTLAFFLAWHYVLQAEVVDHPTTHIQVVSDSETAGSQCGNGKIEASESCDDGNDQDYDGCTRCLVDGFYMCSGEPSVCVRAAGTGNGCGNGVLDSGEQCDDGNGMDGDGCSYRCEAEYGYVCDSSGRCHVRPPCGDGIIESGEECDDGNSNDYDGCNAACQVDNYFECSGTPSVCTRIVLSSSSADTVESLPVESSSSSAYSSVERSSIQESASSSMSLSPRRHVATH